MTENIAALEKRHKQEVRDLEGKVRALLKTAKKATKAVVEAEAIQMGYDLKAKQNEEYELASSMEGVSKCLHDWQVFGIELDVTNLLNV